MTKITVCGPNLNRAAADKGHMHVHATGCADLRHYGRTGRYGGEEPWDVELDSLADLDELLYGDFATDDGSTVAEYVAAYGVDHWLAPCAAKVLSVDTDIPDGTPGPDELAARFTLPGAP